MAMIYKSDTKPLKEFIEEIEDIDSTIVIPDLQRPYVWEPSKVILLVDSIFKKWPFGSLLCWEVKGAKKSSNFIPYRPFWEEYVSRNLWNKRRSKETSINRHSDSYTMILDGQQRLQSLLLALGGESWGFTMTDNEWKKDIEGIDEGIDDRHWSAGTLCLDVEAFLEEYEKCGQFIAGIDVEKCLKWAVTDINTGLSSKDKKHIIPVTSLNDGRFLRFSKIWDIAKPGIHLEAHYEKIITDSFSEIPPKILQVFLKQLTQFMVVVADVKNTTEITRLIIRNYENSEIPDRGIYNDAIVKIFARLNSAGRTLTNEEITLAWLKTGWSEAEEEVKRNIECTTELENLLSEINDNNDENGMRMPMDNLVKILSLLYIIFIRDGNDKSELTFDDKDLIRGDIMKDIGKITLKNWDEIKEAILACKETFEGRKLDECFRSVYAFNIICGWRFVSILSSRHIIGTVRDTEIKFDTAINNAFDLFIDKWYFSTTLSETWSTTANYPAYIGDLCKLHKKIEKCSDPDKAISLLTDELAKWLEDLKQTTINRINSLRAYNRNGVIAYKNILWLWNRLSTDRWSEIQKPMKRWSAVPKLEVDHAIPVRIWEERVEEFIPPEKSYDTTGQEVSVPLNGSAYTKSSLLSEINQLGNCSLLLRSHNRSKQDEPFGSFLNDVYSNDKKQIKTLQFVLKMDDDLLYPLDVEIGQILEKIHARTKEIRSELIEYFNQKERKRQDV